MFLYLGISDILMMLLFVEWFLCSGGEELSAFYLDPYSRPHQKLGGAWMEVGRGTSTSFIGM